MAWTGYLSSFRLLSPMHIGWRKLGNLQQTRPYVTGRSLWGALTARLTRERGKSDYDETGSQIDEQLAFTYFYPSTERDITNLWPWSNQWDEFAWTFLGSYASTALENGHSAEAGSLHETEYIAPYTRIEQPVYLVGYIFEKEGCQLNWRSILNKLQLGGERSYGWGRGHLEVLEEVKNGKCFDYEPVYTENRVLLKASEVSRLLAHAIVKDADIGGDREDRGVTIEPLIGRETNKKSVGFGSSFSDPKICWVPGGKVSRDETFQILEKGIWERYSGS